MNRARIRIVGSYAKALVVTADRIPATGETLLGRDYRETYGGKGSDMAVQAARLGAVVDYLGVIGDDAHGQEFSELMKREGVDVRGVRVDATRPTVVGLSIKDEAGNNIIVVDMGANDLFSMADVDTVFAAMSSPPDVVLAQLEVPLATALYALTRSHAAGSRTILNPAPAQDLRGERLDGVDVITPNQHEARILLGLDSDDAIADEDVAAQLLDLGVGAVVVTLGEAGAAVFERAEGGVRRTHVPPWPVEVVDSNGAGDSFNAALSVALAEGRTIVEAARFAGAVAGLCCEGWETVPSYRDRTEVEEYLKIHQTKREFTS